MKEPILCDFFQRSPIGFAAWKVSKYRVFSGPYFPVFGLNTGKYGPEKTPYLDIFHAVIAMLHTSNIFAGPEFMWVFFPKVCFKVWSKTLGRVKSVQIRSFFLVCFFPYSVRMRENTHQKKLRIWKLFTQCCWLCLISTSNQDHI